MAQIGSVGPSARLGSAPQPQVDPRNFGAGVAEALGHMASAADLYSQSAAAISDSQAELNKQYAERQRRLGRSTAEVGLVRLNAELDRQVISMQDSATASGAGFTEAVKAVADKATADFLATVPVDLRPEYAGRIEGIRQASITGGFNHQILLEDTQYKTDLVDLADKAISSIKSGRSTFEDWKDSFANLRGSSPLSEQETIAIFDKVTTAVQTADMAEAAKVIALAPERGQGTTGVPANGSDIVASGMPGFARGLLNTIAGPESAGLYNNTYGGTKFTSFADHPRTDHATPNGVHSTAAGRYMFVAGTWDLAAKALGLTSFSPENQDRAAWWLAQHDYAANSNGRDLVTDLQSGNFSLISGIKQTLSSTWTGLANVSNEDFFKQVLGQSGTPSSLLADPRYDSLTFDQKSAVLADAEQQAAIVRANNAKQAKAQADALINSMQMGIETNQIGLSDIQTAVKDNNLSYDDYKKLLDQFTTKHEGIVAAMNYVTAVSSPGFDPTTTENVKGSNAQYAQEGQTAIAAKDQAYVNTVLLPLAEKSGYIPPLAEQQLTAQMRSPDPATSAFATQTLAALQTSAPSAFSRLSADTQANVIFAKTAAQYLPPESIQQTLNILTDPAMKDTVKFRTEEAQKSLAPATGEIRGTAHIADIQDALGGTLDVTNTIGNLALENDYSTLYTAFYIKDPDPVQADKLAKEALKHIYGASNVTGEPIVMKFPPEMTNQPFQGSYDYLLETIKKDYALPEGSVFSVVSDSRTEAEFKSGKPASYQVLVKDADGIFYPARTPGSENAAGRRGTPARIAFVVTDEMKMRAVDSAVSTRTINSLQSELDAISLGYLGATHQEAASLDTAYKKVADELAAKGVDVSPAAPLIAANSEVARLQQGIERGFNTPTDIKNLAAAKEKAQIELERLKHNPSDPARLYLDQHTKDLGKNGLVAPSNEVYRAQQAVKAAEANYNAVFEANRYNVPRRKYQPLIDKALDEYAAAKKALDQLSEPSKKGAQ